jgi:hypothetical protein
MVFEIRPAACWHPQTLPTFLAKTVTILFSECRDKEQQRGEENSGQDPPLPETEQASHDQHAYDFAFTVIISSQATAL